MARTDVRELYNRLQDSRFSFIDGGEHHLHSIYQAVKDLYPKLCDDDYLCAENCSGSHRQPEWQHAVRKSLQAQKSSSGPVSKGNQRGYWRFA